MKKKQNLKKKKINKITQWDLIEIAQYELKGVYPPIDFLTDGVSCAPDLWLFYAAVIHDVAYHNLRMHRISLQERKLSDKAIKKVLKIDKKRADREFKENCLRLSEKRSMLYNLIGWRFAVWAYRALKAGGWGAIFNDGILENKGFGIITNGR